MKKTKDFYVKESDKLKLIESQYPHDFIILLKHIMTKYHVSFDDLMDVLPSNTFFKATIKCDLEFYAKYTDYMFMFGLLERRINLDDYEEDDHIYTYTEIAQTTRGIIAEKMYTSFTKKEYLEEIGQKQKKKIK